MGGPGSSWAAPSPPCPPAAGSPLPGSRRRAASVACAPVPGLTSGERGLSGPRGLGEKLCSGRLGRRLGWILQGGPTSSSPVSRGPGTGRPFQPGQASPHPMTLCRVGEEGQGNAWTQPTTRRAVPVRSWGRVSSGVCPPGPGLEPFPVGRGSQFRGSRENTREGGPARGGLRPRTLQEARAQLSTPARQGLGCRPLRRTPSGSLLLTAKQRAGAMPIDQRSVCAAWFARGLG